MKALVLISGGLDSILAAFILREQAIELVPITFSIPFGRHQRTSASRAAWLEDIVYEKLGVRLRRVDLAQEFLEMMLQPAHGLGSQMNPCIDCKILMLNRARQMLSEYGADFVATGEVLGQRPMSQNKRTLRLIEQKSGLQGKLVRPLSAKLLSKTIPEEHGWLNRERLFCISGRGRGTQIALAKHFGLSEYEQPAGGCLLTDPRFAERLKDLIAHKELLLHNIELLKIGRHFRLGPQAKLIVGRDELENKELERLAEEGDILFYPPEDIAGATSLGRGKFDEACVRLAACITIRYADGSGVGERVIMYKHIPQSDQYSLRVHPSDEARIGELRI